MFFFSSFFQIHPKKAIKRLKQYNKEMMLKAFDEVKNNKTPVDKAARLFGVPAQTLRDRVLGKVDIKSSWGKTSLFTSNEEESLVNYLEDLAKVGYGLNRSQLNVLATEMAIKLGKLNQGKSLSDKWYYAFLKRWDHRLKVTKPRGLTSTRASALTQEVVTAYFADLNMVLTENCLQFKPHLIYNLDETGLQPEHRPSKVIAGKSSGKIQAVTSPNSSTTTLIACINAAGTALPPFYVFKGKLRNDELLKGAAPNSAYEMSDSGWSNGQILMKYLKNHFVKYVQKGLGDNNDPILLIYDGHASHVNLDIMKWAIEHNVILLFCHLMPLMLYSHLMLVVLPHLKLVITVSATFLWQNSVDKLSL
jgi:hypothetical protein